MASRVSAHRSEPLTDSATPRHAVPPLVCCDLCEAPFVLAPEIASQGVIRGLLVCSLCIEDALFAKQLEAQP